MGTGQIIPFKVGGVKQTQVPKQTFSPLNSFTKQRTEQIPKTETATTQGTITIPEVTTSLKTGSKGRSNLIMVTTTTPITTQKQNQEQIIIPAIRQGFRQGTKQESK
jgi:hypothetical protein